VTVRVLAVIVLCGCGGQRMATTVDDGGGGYAVCASSVQPSFGSINGAVLQVSCGIGTGACHSTAGSINSGGLDLQGDPYTALLGPDGKGAPANNLVGTVKNLIRVKPGDPTNSYLVIKLHTMTGTDPQYGSGMPFGTPGSVCPPTLDAINQWIASGAAKTP
jgi:hypothetical protein